MNEIVRVVGQQIKELRLQKNLTIEDVAQRSGCTSGFLSQIERHKAIPSIALLYNIAKALDTRIADFFPETANTAKVVRHNAQTSFRLEGSPFVYVLRSTRFPTAAVTGLVVTILPAQEALLPLEELSIQPLQLVKESCEIIMESARTGLACNVLSMAMAGGSSPVTLAGTLVDHNAEILGGLVLSQLTRKGAKFIYGSSTTAMDA